MSNYRNQLLRVLSVPIFPHEQADPTEVVADYLLDNNVIPVVFCKDCIASTINECSGLRHCRSQRGMNRIVEDDEFCSWGEKREE